jgi:hypothetical protein
MSKMCGDTARYHRIRKQRAVKRASVRALRSELAADKNATAEKKNLRRSNRDYQETNDTNYSAADRG